MYRQKNPIGFPSNKSYSNQYMQPKKNHYTNEKQIKNPHFGCFGKHVNEL